MTALSTNSIPMGHTKYFFPVWKIKVKAKERKREGRRGGGMRDERRKLVLPFFCMFFARDTFFFLIFSHPYGLGEELYPGEAMLALMTAYETLREETYMSSGTCCLLKFRVLSHFDTFSFRFVLIGAKEWRRTAHVTGQNTHFR